LLIAIYLLPHPGNKGGDAGHVQQKLKHHHQVTRQVDDCGVDDEGDEEDEELQDRFRALFDMCDLTISYTCRSRIGAKFLRDNRDLLA